MWGNMKESNYFKDPHIDGKVKLKCIINKYDGSVD